MHISLDSAVGRQPLLGNVGEKLLPAFPGAAAAYSLRALNGNGDPVVRVRRDSDNDEKDFTAFDVTSGELVNWVNEIPVLSTARNYTTAPYETFTGASSSGFTASNSSGTAFAGFDVDGSNTNSISLSFDLTIRSGSPQISLRADYDSTAFAVSNTQTYSTSGTKTITLTATNDFGFIAFSEGDIPSDFDVSNFQITAFNANGFVETWYDQAGSNDAVQTTTSEQPKIVGEVTSGQPHALLGGLVFSGDDDALFANSLASSFNGDARPISAFSVSEVSANTETQAVWAFSNSSDNQPLKQWQYRSTGYGLIYRADSGTNINDFNAGSYSVNEEYLHTIIVNDSEVMNGYENGTLLSDIDSLDANIGTFTLNQFKMSPNPYGTLREVIFYDSDQSSNRTRIEENINAHYDIYS